jgi:hypothetical protein
MNLERASERAYSVRGHKSAARLYNDIEYELALGEPGPRLETAGERALAHLEERFPDVRDAARQVEAPPSLSRRAGDALYGVRQQAQRPRPTSRRAELAMGRRPREQLYAYMHAHPVGAVAIVVLLIIVVVKLWVYVVLGVVAIAALRKYRGSAR